PLRGSGGNRNPCRCLRAVLAAAAKTLDERRCPDGDIPRGRAGPDLLRSAREGAGGKYPRRPSVPGMKLQQFGRSARSFKGLSFEALLSRCPRTALMALPS